jgi:hypothetical protein
VLDPVAVYQTAPAEDARERRRNTLGEQPTSRENAEESAYTLL